MKLEWTPDPQSHLLHLDSYLFERSPAGGDRVVDRILAVVGSLDRFPLSGKPGRVDGTRELVVPSTSYIVAYRIQHEAVHVLAIMHGAQRWPAFFDE